MSGLLALGVDLPSVGLLGVGRIGSRLGRVLLKQGHGVTAWNRTPGRCEALRAAGAQIEQAAGRAAQHADVVLLALSDGDAVRDVLFGGPVPTVDHLRGDAVIVDVTTTGPRVARSLDEELSSRGLRYVAAPLVGSLKQAAAGTLTTLVGGEAEAIELVLPVLDAWSAPGRVVPMGDVTSAASARLVAVTAGAAALEALGEAMRLGADLGVERGRLVESLRAGVLGPLVTAREEALLAADTTVGEYDLRMFAAEMALGLYAARAALPAAEAAYLQAQVAVGQGLADRDFLEVALRREGVRGEVDAGEVAPRRSEVGPDAAALHPAAEAPGVS